MKLRQVSVEGVGRFGSLTRMEGLGPGVNILSAGNEAGKSTMFRAIRTCLFERHLAKNEDVKALATDGLSLPVRVTLGFEHDGKTYELTKSFLKSPSANLKCNDVEIARNREADELIWEILGITPESSRSVDEAAFGILWVGQGQSFTVPQPSEAAATALNDVIQQEVGTLVGGERARKLLTEVKEELSKLITDTRKPRARGPLDLAISHCETLKAELADAAKRLADLDQSLDTLAKLRADLKRIADPADTQRMRREQGDAEQQLKAGEEAAATLQRFEIEERQALALLKAQEGKLLELRERCHRVDENRSRIKALVAELAPLDEEETAVRLKLNEALARKSEFDTASDAYDTEERMLQRLAGIAQKSAAREAVAARLSTIVSLEKRYSHNEAALKSNSVDDAAIKSLEAIERAVEKIIARIEAAAARITIEQKPGSQVSVNGRPIDGNMVRSVTEPMTIMVGDQVAITVSPPPGSLAAAEAERNGQNILLKALLGQHGVASPAELRRIRSERIALEEEARNLKAELTAQALKLPLAAEIARLTAEITQVDSDSQRALAETGAATLPAPGDIERQQNVLYEARADLRVQRAQCESLIASQNDKLSLITGARGKADGQMKEIDAQLMADLANLPDERRQQMLEEAERELAAKSSDHRAKAALLAEKRSTAPDRDEIERLRNRAERLRAATANRAAEIEALRHRIANLEGQIQTAGGDGLGEKLADLRAQSDMAEAELERQTARMETLLLLRDVVEQSYARRRDQLHAPLRRHLKPFLHDVFPQAEIELGEGFAVSGLRRSGPASELFGRLSHGTQEQVAVLVRLAMGAMICERGPDVPIILDDALVFSDDARIEQMFDAINRAGRNQQVIVLTCRARTFASLGGRQLHIV